MIPQRECTTRIGTRSSSARDSARTSLCLQPIPTGTGYAQNMLDDMARRRGVSLGARRVSLGDPDSASLLTHMAHTGVQSLHFDANEPRQSIDIFNSLGSAT